jgi:hypothetical protein
MRHAGFAVPIDTKQRPSALAAVRSGHEVRYASLAKHRTSLWRRRYGHLAVAVHNDQPRIAAGIASDLSLRAALLTHSTGDLQGIVASARARRLVQSAAGLADAIDQPGSGLAAAAGTRRLARAATGHALPAAGDQSATTAGVAWDLVESPARAAKSAQDAEPGLATRVARRLVRAAAHGTQAAAYAKTALATPGAGLPAGDPAGAADSASG